MTTTETRTGREGPEQFEELLLEQLLTVRSELFDVGPGANSQVRRAKSRRTDVLAAACLAVLALVAAVTATTVDGRGTADTPLIKAIQTSQADWQLVGQVAASGWHRQSTGNASPLELICPTTSTCITSGVDLGVNQNTLPTTQFDLAVSHDAGGHGALPTSLPMVSPSTGSRALLLLCV